MSEFVEQLALCVERGKVNRESLYPPDLHGQDGTDELAKQALEQGLKPDTILEGCILGMDRIGAKFSENKAFVPELLMAAKAMTAAMTHLKPFFQSGAVKRKGTFVIGTVAGDLHDIGKNLVAMVVEGGGFEVIDLGTNVTTAKFLASIEEHPGCSVGMSALLTTTMVNMEGTIKAIKEKYPETLVLVGGAPVTKQYADKIGADGYSPDPQGAVAILNKKVA
ncbi:cobalamin-dependent protein [candidate division KSB1 bacterium]|nr:cobalamin-dependent protein [candidate division KSB1 bacterium]RQW10192.1 MAG: cobalamin-binding protein [candidate division KSB1 bacterium]